MSTTEIVENIKSLIADKKVENTTVREEIEKLGTNTLTQEEAKDVLSFLEKERFEFFKEWQLEVASEYM